MPKIVTCVPPDTFVDVIARPAYLDPVEARFNRHRLDHYRQLPLELGSAWAKLGAQSMHQCCVVLGSVVPTQMKKEKW
ncbi:hypothetical protein ACLOJK_009773 [Asimina triloba]